MSKKTPQSAFRGRKITVMGLGLNQGGLGIAKWLLRHGARLTITDLKTREQLAPSIEALAEVKGARRVRYVLGRHRAEDFRRADMIIQNPGVPRDSEYLAVARKAGVAIESDISIFFRLCPHPIVGVSGTKGKTSVTAMLGAMLSQAFGEAVVGGNIRRSPLDRLDALMASKRPVPVVLELSSWQLESLKAAEMSPAIAVLTNVLPDHLNRYDGMKDYAAAKELIYAWQLPTGVAVVPYDNAWTRKMGARVRGERFWASMKPLPQEQNGLFYRGRKAVVRSQGVETALFEAGDVALPGAHNLWNALLAAGGAYLRGADPKAIRAALRAFRGVPHRLERVRELRGVAYWNDTAATTPEASVAAMETLFAKKKGVLIAGGADKELVFGAWAKAVKRYAKKVVLFKGTATPKMRAALARAGVKLEDDAVTMREAVARASAAAKRGEAVLLSPGCASFGIFVNEFDRGDQFREEAKKLR
ncbi:MAG TPA: UDP-N-acetylmuramoyl-L-alanine--D-glutamate ligase [Patescibacteria group bacterium]|nr:UDP-N-acetylmuramoyl-L-alanine--D-glutamate ligase [Patescibacteria group bacterium]